MNNTELRAADRERGMTLVELLVAMTISLIIVLAAVASLTMARRGFNTVDAASQLRDSGRFAADLIQRLGVQAGYKDIRYAGRPCLAGEPNCPPAPDVMGMDNALSSSTDPLNISTPRASGSVGYGSDILILRYQASELNPWIFASPADNTMIDCAGFTGNGAPADRNDRMLSVLHVAVSSTTGEPTLMCTYKPPAGTFKVQPIIDGVENFQVLYGVDGVVPSTAPTATTDRVPERFLSASQMTVPGNAAATEANWRRVRSIRIGMVLRGPPNSAQGQTTPTLYPFGPSSDSTGGLSGSALSSSSDPGTVFTPPSDGRLRQVVTFTVHLRNFQEL